MVTNFARLWKRNVVIQHECDRFQLQTINLQFLIFWICFKQTHVLLYFNVQMSCHNNDLQKRLVILFYFLNPFRITKNIRQKYFLNTMVHKTSKKYITQHTTNYLRTMLVLHRNVIAHNRWTLKIGKKLFIMMFCL